jgi:hypothetical protein
MTEQNVGGGSDPQHPEDRREDKARKRGDRSLGCECHDLDPDD